MTISALELNDQSLLIQAEDGALHAEPGFARLSGDGIETGEEARAVAWREPQHVYNQYWCHLNQTQLPIRQKHARHHADIAFAQLQKLWRNAGSPESLIVLVPGSFSREQLSLLLGLIQALPAQASAVIDNALAACLDVARDTLYVDLQMHESVLTVCRPGEQSVSIVDQEVFPGLGMNQVQNTLARYISDFLIESYRFDPLHSSETEQAIFDQIPHWLTRLRWEKTFSVQLETQNGEHPCILDRDVIRERISERLSGVRSFIEKWRGADLLLSHASGLLPGLIDEFSAAPVQDQTEATQRCLSHHSGILGQIDELHRVRELNRIQSESALSAGPAVNGERLATHLLCGNQALPLSRPLSIRVAESGPQLQNEFDDEAALTIVMRDDSLEALHLAEEVELPQSCRPGELIRIGEHELKLIRVHNN
jgi:hypothetical protein